MKESFYLFTSFVLIIICIGITILTENHRKDDMHQWLEEHNIVETQFETYSFDSGPFFQTKGCTIFHVEGISRNNQKIIIWAKYGDIGGPYFYKEEPDGRYLEIK